MSRLELIANVFGGVSCGSRGGVSPGKNFANSSDQGPTFANAVSVWRTQKSGDKDIFKTYVAALGVLAKTPDWERLDEAQHDEIARPLRQCADPAWNNQTIRHLRSETEALSAAVEKVHQILEGERLATVSVAQFFEGGIENEEQLEQALIGIRDEFSRLLGAGKKVIVR